MHGDDIVILSSDTTPHTSQFLHMSTNTQQQTQMDTQRPDVCSSLTRNPEYTQIPLVVVFNQFTLVNRPDSQLSLDGRDQRGSLEQGTSQGFKSSRKGLFVGEGIVESDDADVFFSSTLLGFDKSGSSVDTDNQTSSNFRVECSGMSSLLDS